ncbi:hypothetical protein HMPREF2625_01065 [Rothia sp. HMSC064D08]|uniref:hypothetical protein n=2 Tax=Rothia dentocariosa TaxID=2047 RepID=UPI0008A290CA|nr:hypothetical protein HMPREF2625_01065 [Rothia sp. HMSC064D08]PLA17991.1 hypothetical protein CYK04_10360 [Rothia dentocariosa]
MGKTYRMHNSETSLLNYIPVILPFELISRGFMSFRNTLHLLIFATLILPVAGGGGGIYRLHWLELHRTSTDPQGLHLGDY